MVSQTNGRRQASYCTLDREWLREVNQTEREVAFGDVDKVDHV